MSKMGNIHFQAQEDARDGIMEKKSFLEEYGDGALDIWEEFNGEDPDEYMLYTRCSGNTYGY